MSLASGAIGLTAGKETVNMNEMMLKLRRFVGFGLQPIASPNRRLSDEELREQETKQRAMRTRAIANEWAAQPTGPMATVPKVARAFHFYMREPVLFRGYSTIKGGMRDMLKEHGIETSDAELADHAAMLPIWQRLEAQLPAGPSAHELWATRFDA